MKTIRAMQAVLVIICASALPAFAQSVTLVTTYDYPNAVQTESSAINDRGDISGIFIDSSGTELGFIRRQDGGFTPPLAVPHGSPGTTYVSGMNDSRVLCGDYLGKFGLARGFFYSRGRFTTYNVPGASETSVLGVNDAGNFVGWYVNGHTAHAYISLGGNLTDIHLNGTRLVIPAQLNSSNAVSGFYYTGSVIHGFYQDAQGGLHYPIDFAGATSTYILGINDENWMPGQYEDSTGVWHGLLYQPPSTFITYDYPGTTNTSLNNINRHGGIAGSYTDSSGNYHGFIAQLSSEK